MPADSFFSAICVAMSMLYGADAVTEFLALFPQLGEAKTPPLRITSLLLSADGIDLLPMPKLYPNLSKWELASRKQFKQIQWVSTKVFQHLIQGEDLSDQLELFNLQERNQPYTVQSGAVWVTRDEQEDLGGKERQLWHVQRRPRVTIDRRTNASTAFSSGSVFYDRGVSFYVLMRWNSTDDELRSQVEATIHALGHGGIGGERSYGHGLFTPDFQQFNQELGISEGGYFTLLSPYFPQNHERFVFGGSARYDVVLRRGWMSLPPYSNTRRPTVRMIDSGAVLRMPPDAEPVGAVVDATPNIVGKDTTYRIRRYGLAWPIRIATQAVETATVLQD